MEYCIDSLYTAAANQAPYQPKSEMEQSLFAECTNLYEQLNARLPELQDELWTLNDDLNILSHYRSQHFFALGLDLGLSLSRELEGIRGG